MLSWRVYPRLERLANATKGGTAGIQGEIEKQGTAGTFFLRSLAPPWRCYS
jgi:hypothetical protein